MNERIDVRDMELIKDVLQLSVAEVIEAMTSISVLTADKSAEKYKDKDDKIVSITFNNGFSFDGIFFIKMKHELARNLTQRILSQMPDITEEDIWDAVGELLNIIVGKFKAVLTSHNYELFDFSTPNRFLTAQDYDSLSQDRKTKLSLDFVAENCPFAVEVFFNQ